MESKMIIDGIPMPKINLMAQKYGLVPVFVAADEENTDSEIQLRTATGKATGIAIQLSGRFYTTTEWLEEEAMWFGAERTKIEAAMADAIARFTSR
jgi:hypothetical protein